LIDLLAIEKEEHYVLFFALQFFFFFYRCLCSSIRTEATLIGEWVSDFFSSSLATSVSASSKQVNAHIKRRRTCSSSSFFFFFFYHLYRWLLVDFNKTVDVSTQLRRMQLSFCLPSNGYLLFTLIEGGGQQQRVDVIATHK